MDRAAWNVNHAAGLDGQCFLTDAHATIATQQKTVISLSACRCSASRSRTCTRTFDERALRDSSTTLDVFPAAQRVGGEQLTEICLSQDVFFARLRPEPLVCVTGVEAKDGVKSQTGYRQRKYFHRRFLEEERVVHAGRRSAKTKPSRSTTSPTRTVIGSANIGPA